jgi:hypothetical protein
MKHKRMLFVVFALIAVLVVTQFVLAAEYSPAEEEAAIAGMCAEFGGTYISNGNGTGTCYNLTDAWTLRHHCEEGEAAGAITLYGDVDKSNDIENPLTYVTKSVCGFVEIPSNSSLIGKGVAKINTISSKVYLGDTIKVTGMGAPTILRLQGNGTTYKLPLVLGSVKQLEDGTFTAEFYTIDPATSQPLVAPGKYKADIFGSNGPAGAQFDITIVR